MMICGIFADPYDPIKINQILVTNPKDSEPPEKS